jgi:DNA polymerase-3 subunit epsilon
MRYVVFDTETTGLNHATGDRVFEIGCVEIVNKAITGRVFHSYINPEKEISLEVQEICKIDPSILSDKPKFSDVAKGFIDFISLNQDGEEEKAILIAHNARFDMDFINSELSICGMDCIDGFDVFDTVRMAKVRNPKSPASLDHLCRSMGIDLSVREKNGHGALTDSKLLSEVFLNFIKDEPDNYVYVFNKAIESFFGIVKRESVIVSRSCDVCDEDRASHEEFLSKMGVERIW